MEKEMTAMKEQPQEKKTDFSGTPCVQQESDRKEEKELTKKRFRPLLVYFLCVLGIMMILLPVLLIVRDYIASLFTSVSIDPDFEEERRMHLQHHGFDIDKKKINGE